MSCELKEHTISHSRKTAYSGAPDRFSRANPATTVERLVLERMSGHQVFRINLHTTDLVGTQYRLIRCYIYGNTKEREGTTGHAPPHSAALYGINVMLPAAQSTPMFLLRVVLPTVALTAALTFFSPYVMLVSVTF